MKQKLALARALIHEPPVLLLDEPTSAMDPESSRLVRDEISRLRSAQRAIIICTHNLAEAEALADSVAIIYQGRILVQGTPGRTARIRCWAMRNTRRALRPHGPPIHSRCPKVSSSRVATTRQCVFES